ncbi:MAG: hypothetical protein V7607_3473 [Solirubrobacteraceae bacterium]
MFRRRRRLLDDLERPAATPPAGLRAAAVEEVETAIGPVLLHTDDRVITPIVRAHRDWEPAEGAFLRGAAVRGGVAVDVGANIGYLTIVLARAVGPDGIVLAVEPEPSNLALLRANIWRHGLRNVCLLAAAASDSIGYLGLREGEPDNTGSYETHRAAGADDLVVPAVVLDDVLAGVSVDLIKIDVQGSDHDVVAGLHATLARSPTANVLVEFWPGGMRSRDLDPAAVLANYRELGRPLALLGEDGVPVEADDTRIQSACEASPSRFVNLVLGPTR